MSTTADKIIEIASSQIGTRAAPVKKVKYNTWYYGGVVSGSAYDWCEAFVQWVFSQAGASELLYSRTANCGYAAKAFQDRGRLVTSGYKRGDVVFFHWTQERSTLVPGTYVSDHVGIIEKVNSDGTLVTIEGNTGGGDGAVMRRNRDLGVISCAGRPDYSGSPSPTPSGADIDVVYKVRSDGRWLPEVRNLEDYAGINGKAITDVAIKVSKGQLKYRVHVKDGEWLDYVTGYNVNDDENGYAGDKKPIDAIEVFYVTPNDVVANHGFYRAKYRVAPIGQDYYDWQYDNEMSDGQDGYAGDFGTAIDSLQIEISK